MLQTLNLQNQQPVKGLYEKNRYSHDKLIMIINRDASYQFADMCLSDSIICE